MTAYYFDTNALWKFYRGGESGSAEVRQLVANPSHTILVSPLTRLEYVTLLLTYLRGGSLNAKQFERLIQRFYQDFREQSGTFKLTIVPDAAIFKEAERLLLHYARRHGFKAMDALHIALALHLKERYSTLTMVTFDKAMWNVCQEIALSTFDIL